MKDGPLGVLFYVDKSNLLSNLISFDRIVMTYNIVNKLSPESLWDKFELRSVH